MHELDAVRLVVLAVALAACGARPPPEPVAMPPEMGRAVPIEWKAEQGDGDLVIVSIVVDGKSIELGALPAATEFERGTPHTCALRIVDPVRSELTCGDMTAFYAAELRDGELVLIHGEGSASREVERIAVSGEGLAVKPYRLPE